MNIKQWLVTLVGTMITALILFFYPTPPPVFRELSSTPPDASGRAYTDNEFIYHIPPDKIILVLIVILVTIALVLKFRSVKPS